MLVEWVDLFLKMRYACIQRMLSQSSCGVIGSEMRMILSFTKVSLILLPKAQDYNINHLLCASRHDFNRTLSGGLAISLSGLMPHTMSHNMKITCYLQSSQGSNGDMMSNLLRTGLRCSILTFLN